MIFEVEQYLRYKHRYVHRRQHVHLLLDEATSILTFVTTFKFITINIVIMVIIIIIIY